MKASINSRKLGRTITFYRPGKAYVFADLNGETGILGNKICHGGHLSGSTIEYHDDSDEEFERIVRRWYRAYIRNRND